jgi:hypothetical protein
MLADIHRLLSDGGVIGLEVAGHLLLPAQLDGVSLHEHVNSYQRLFAARIVARAGFRMTAIVA